MPVSAFAVLTSPFVTRTPREAFEIRKACASTPKARGVIEYAPHAERWISDALASKAPRGIPGTEFRLRSEARSCDGKRPKQLLLWCVGPGANDACVTALLPLVGVQPHALQDARVLQDYRHA